MMKKIMVCAVLLASPAQGMVYMWRDPAGIAHYTNKEYDIPAHYKVKAKALYPEATDSGQIQLNSTNGQTSPPPISNQQIIPDGQRKEQAAVTAPLIKNSSQSTSARRGRVRRENRTDEE
jgi:hypothetical protein